MEPGTPAWHGPYVTARPPNGLMKAANGKDEANED
jgi:hypothetical protein